MSSASFGTVNATGMNVTGILQATEVITTKPLQVSNITSTGTVIASNISASGTLGVTGAATLSSVTASGTLGVTGAATLSNVTASGTLGVTGLATLSNVTASSGIINKNLVVSGSTISKNDFMYVDATMPIPSMLLNDPNSTPTSAVAYFDKDTKMIYPGCGALYVDHVKRSEVMYLNKYPFNSLGGSIQFTDFSLVDVCSSNGATLRSVSAGYDMRSLAATNEYVRWRSNLAPVTVSYMLALSVACQYAYWRMNMSGIYIDFINVLDGFETVNNTFWYPFISADMRKVLDGTTVQIDTASNSATLSKVGLYPDLGSPVNAYKFASEYIITGHHGMNDGFGRPMYHGHTWTTWLSNANELYEAMLNGDIWDTKYTNQEVSQGGPKLDNVDTANNYNLWNFGAKYSDANWNNYYSNAFITFVNTTRVTTGVDSNIYYPGPMSYGGLDNYLKIQLPTNNNCWGSSNLANATAFVSSFGTSIMPLRPVMKVTEGMSYFDWCECTSHLYQQTVNDGHTSLRLFGYSATNTTPSSPTTVPLNSTGIVGSQFIANNGKMLVPYTFPQFYASKSSLTVQTLGRHLFSGRNIVNANKVGTGSGRSAPALKSNTFSLLGKSAYKPDINMSYATNIKTAGFHYTEPIMYTEYAFGVISNALTSNNFGAITLSPIKKDVFENLYGPTVSDTHTNMLSNVQYANVYKNSMEYLIVTSALGLSNSVNANNVVVPYSSNLSQVIPFYAANASVLYTGIQADVVPAVPDNAPDDFGPIYFGFYARNVTTGNAWNSTAWYNGMTTSFDTYKETLSNTCFIPTDYYTISSQHLFGQIDSAHMSTKTNSNVNVTSNVGFAFPGYGMSWPSGGTTFVNTTRTTFADGFMKPDSVVSMALLGYNIESKELRGLFALKVLLWNIYRKGFFLPRQLGGLNPCDLSGLLTTAAFDYMHNTLKCDSIIYDLRNYPGGGVNCNMSASFNYANLATANTWIDIGWVGQDRDKMSSSNQKWTPSETVYVGRKLGFNKETYRASPNRFFLQNDKYPTVTPYVTDDNVKIIKLADGACVSGGESEFTSEGFTTCGQVGNAKIINLARNTGGATAANFSGVNAPALASNIVSLQSSTGGRITNHTRNIGGVLYANQGVYGLDSVVLDSNAVPGVNITYPGNYVNPALDAGLRTGWQDAGVNGSNVVDVRNFFVTGPDYIKPTSGPLLGNMKTQNWRDCDLERALLIDKNVSYANFSNIAYYQANKSLFNYIPY